MRQRERRIDRAGRSHSRTGVAAMFVFGFVTALPETQEEFAEWRRAFDTNSSPGEQE